MTMRDMARVEQIFSRLPRTIRVGSLYFNMVVSSTDILSEEGPLGMTRSDVCEIVIRLTGNLSQDVNTAVHELNHAVYHSQGLCGHSQEQENEEAVVNRLTNGQLALLFDNPKYMQWLHSALCEISGQSHQDNHSLDWSKREVVDLSMAEGDEHVDG
jgi:hypothetical protein